MSQAGTKVAGGQVEGVAAVSTVEKKRRLTAVRDGELKGRFGLGAVWTIGGLSGINARYFVLDKLALGLNLGVASWTFRENAPETDPETEEICPGEDCEFEQRRTIAVFGVGLEAIYFVRLGRAAGQLPFYADFGVGGRFVYYQGVNASDVRNNLDDPTQFNIEFPAIVQLRFGEYFVLSPEFGINFAIVPGSRAEGDLNPGFVAIPDVGGEPSDPFGPDGASGSVSGPGFGFQVTDGVGLFGGASLHFYF